MHMAILMFGAPGVDILYPDPGFPIYRSMIEFTGARPVPIPMREANDFAFSADETLSLITPETRLIILNSPANPTGGVTPREEIDKLVAGLARFPDVAILSDEIYGQMTYDNHRHQTLLAYPEIRDRLILLDGWSKTYAMTGWRLGFSVWPRGALRRGAQVGGQFLFLRQCGGAVRRPCGADRAAGRGSRHGGRIRRAPSHRRRRAQRAAGRARRDAEGRLLRLSQHCRDRLEGEGARRRAARGGGRGDDRRARFRRPWRGLYPRLLRQFAREHRRARWRASAISCAPTRRRRDRRR